MRLIIECGGERREYHLREGRTVVGRDPSCCDIIVPDPSLSRRHLECALEGGRLLVRDLKTKNGTFLGGQRIEEAHLPPGVALRAGNVTFLIEADEARPETKPVPPQDLPRAKQAEPLGDLESRVPKAENYEEEEEPTPSVDEVPPSPAGAAEEARVVVRDGRWYLRDPATGAEVEIVPVGHDGAAQPAAGFSAPAPAEAEPLSGAEGVPSGLPPGAPAEVAAQLPARIVRRAETFPARPVAARMPGQGGFRAVWSDRKRRRTFLGVALIAVILVALLGYALFKPEKPVFLLPRAEYRARADQAVKPFAKAAADAQQLTAAGKKDDAAKLLTETAGAAVEQLRLLQREPVEGKPKFAPMLIDALAADSAAVKDFPKAWEGAQRRWEEVRKSSESTEAAIALARARLAWIEAETTDMLTLADARLFLKKGDNLKAIKKAADIAMTSPYWKEAEPLIQQATDAIVRAADADASQRRWAEASSKLKELIAVRPEIADTLAARIKEYNQRESERGDFDAATKLADAGKYDEAARILAQLPADSPFAEPAADMLAGFKLKQASQLALAEYAAGRGENALDILSKAGLGDSPDAGKIKGVVADKARAMEELKAAHFAEAKAALEGILRLESAPANVYFQDAKRTLDSLPALTKAGAQLLVDEADRVLEGHDDRKYRLARAKLEDALRLDPANKDAKDRLNRFVKEAVREFNKALQLPRTLPDQIAEVLRLLNDVRDRLPPEHELYPQVTKEIDDLDRIQRKPAAGGNP